jgi:two-component system nitrogen regulation response regulator GlnG
VEEKFRSDLYYRLSVFTIYMPPLRERGDDIALLARHFMRRFNRELKREVSEIALETLERLTNYAWPGNIRELQSVLKIALLQSSGRVLLPAFLPPLVNPKAEPGPMLAAPALDLEAFIQQRLTPEADNLYAEAHREVDRLLLSRTLEYANGNNRDAARLLGISRQTMRTKFRSLGLHVAHSVESDDD